MKVLYTGVYRDGTGWGHAAIDYILALDAAGVEVVPRPIKFTGGQAEIPERIRELEQNNAQGCDVVIQHILPHHMMYDAGVGKNIGLMVYESSNFNQSSWPDHVKLMDEIWVSNSIGRKAVENSGYKGKIRVIPHACDYSKYLRSYKPLDLKQSLEGNFAFYFIGENTRRKNLFAALAAFHSEFDNDEPVDFVIKTHLSGMSEQQCFAETEKMCTEIKRGIKKYANLDKYKREIISCKRLSEEDMMRLHVACDCFVMPSYGEGWCIPAFDAMAMGKTPVVTRDAGFDFITDWHNGVEVNSTEDPCFGMTETFNDIYTCQETMQRVEIQHLKDSMRDIYMLHKNRPEEIERMYSNGLKMAEKYNHQNVGKLMKEALSEQ